MKLSTERTFVLVLALFLAVSRSAVASSPAPCTKAVSSTAGTFLVITDAQLVPIGENVFEAQRVTLGVFPREDFINAKDRVAASATYWRDGPQWSVILDASNSHPVPACPLSLVTNDGEFLVILARDLIPDPALQIYRRRDHLGDPMREGPDHGVFIRGVRLEELWPADKFSSLHRQSFTDSSPQWFAGGTFEFSSDSRSLMHKTRWGNTVRISLLNGTVQGSSSARGLTMLR